MGTSAPVSGNDGGIDGDSIVDWITQRARPLTYVGLGVVALVAVVAIVKQGAAKKNENAERALMTAQSAFYGGNTALAKSDLEKLATRYEGTPAGAQGTILLAQILFGEGKHDDGINRLKAVSGNAPDEFGSAIEELMASGYADSKRYAEAIDHLTKAAAKARFAADKAIYQADAARLMMLAGKTAEARKAWEALASDPESPVGSEAKVRLGEIDAKAASK